MTTWSATRIAAEIARQTFQRRCLLLVDCCNWTGYECDVLGVTRDLRVIDVEIKISRADLKADARKDKWWHRYYPGWAVRDAGLPQGTARPHPPKVWKHYFAMPAAIWKPELVEFLPSPASGVLLFEDRADGRLAVTCVQRATPSRDAPKLTAEQVIDIARLASLRMWDAYDQRDAARRALADREG